MDAEIRRLGLDASLPHNRTIRYVLLPSQVPRCVSSRDLVLFLFLVVNLTIYYQKSKAYADRADYRKQVFAIVHLRKNSRS
jgi:hypothetical protein